MSDFHNSYKPFRNFLRNFELYDSLEVCWHIASHYSSGKKFPTNLEIPIKLKYNTDKTAEKLFLVNDWELEFLVSEVISYCTKRIYDKKKSFYNLKHRAKAVNYIRGFHDLVYKDTISDEKVFLELNRIAHQQFIWQPALRLANLYRYYIIYTDDDLDKLIIKTFNLDYKKLIIIAFLLMLQFNSKFKIKCNFQSNIDLVPTDSFKIFLDFFGTTLDHIKSLIDENRKYDERLVYAFQPIRRFPIIIDDYYYCPIPTLLFWQTTKGIYYHLINKQGFDESFGRSFQNYLVKYITKVNTDGKIQYYPEKVYGNPEKRTADIILVDKESVLLIECKTKRMLQEAKENLIDKSAIENDIKKISFAFQQLYKQVDEYKNNKYPHLKCDKTKKIFLMVVTLENWFLGFNPYLYDRLKDEIIIKLESIKKSKELIKEIPYFFFSAEEFEEVMQVINKHGIKYYCEKFNSEKGFDAFKSFEYKTIFQEEVDEIFHSLKSNSNEPLISNT